MTIKNGYDQQTADEMREGASMTDYSRLVADQHAQEKGRLEALQFAAYQKATLEQAKASIAAREARERLVFEGLKMTPEGGIQAIGQAYAQARTFTREEVLTILRAYRAGNGGLTEAITCFERIE